MAEPFSEFTLGDMVATYFRRGHEVGLEVLPWGCVRASREDETPDPLIHLAVRGGSASAGFVAGHSLRGGSSGEAVRFVGQEVETGEGEIRIITRFDREQVELRHVLAFQEGSRAFRTRTEVAHRGGVPVVLEMLSSVSLSGVSPLPGGRDPGSLVVHRIRSAWSSEGRVVSEPAEDLQLEPSWSLHGVRVERFGQVGSLPVRKFFPFAAVEDTLHSVVWAIQVASPASWQIELWRRGPALGISGGLADREFGHWFKTLGPGDRFETPWAHVTVARGGLDSVSQRLLDLIPAVHPGVKEGRLPLVFNEFCSTWGKPTSQTVRNQLAALEGRGLDVFVVDAGWYADPEHGWEQSQGDWNVGRHLFPEGLAPVAQAIRRAGMTPGLWFELETCGPLSQAYQNTRHLLKRDGVPVTSGLRRFWDMRDPWVQDYLGERVIRRLADDGFGYVKIDYNESLGIGCDGNDSYGEGLRRNVEATQDFFRRLRREVPGLVLENCASGGHRLEPSMMALSDFSSFSDAHECLEIPVIAANLHRVVPPWHSQIWAVLRETDSPDRIVYSLASTFLGVLCLSGAVEKLAPSQWGLVERGLEFHRGIAGILCRGTTVYHGPKQRSYRQLSGWQGIVRVACSDREALVVVHRFAGADHTPIEIQLPWEGDIADRFGLPGTTVALGSQTLRVDLDQPFTAVALRVTRR